MLKRFFSLKNNVMETETELQLHKRGTIGKKVHKLSG